MCCYDKETSQIHLKAELIDTYKLQLLTTLFLINQVKVKVPSRATRAHWTGNSQGNVVSKEPSHVSNHSALTVTPS